jgi:hypothetical protein
MKLKCITKWSETSPGDLWYGVLEIPISNMKCIKYEFIAERIEDKNHYIAAWIKDLIGLPAGYLGVGWNFYLLDSKDLILYSYLKYKTPRFFELLENK